LDTFHAARDGTKSSTFLVDAFRSPKLGVLGYIQGGKPYFYKDSTRRHTINTEFDITERIAINP
jgi:L-asparaginase/glutamin-(asparagin-)ase